MLQSIENLGCQVLPIDAKSCHVLPSVAKSCQVLQSVAKCCQVLPSVAKCCQVLPSIAKCCPVLPSCRELTCKELNASDDCKRVYFISKLHAFIGWDSSHMITSEPIRTQHSPLSNALATPIWPTLTTFQDSNRRKVLLDNGLLYKVLPSIVRHGQCF